MLNIDQVRLLERKVVRAVELIKQLSDEKIALKKQLDEKDSRISELENLLLAFKDDQSKIEEKIVKALNELSALEDAVYSEKEEPSTASVMAEAKKYNEKESTDESDNKNSLEKDLDDVLGSSSEEPKQEEINQQLDIF